MDINNFNELLEKRLKHFLTVRDNDNLVSEAALYAVTNGGKRVRARLVYEFCGLCGGVSEKADSAAVAAATAIECIHSFSLVHDDLPCMDDDLIRRGMPSCHAKYGEAIALLAGDALALIAPEIIAADDHLSDRQKVRMINVLTRLSGVRGMIDGQLLDMIYAEKAASAAEIEEMYKQKTGALLSAACQLGCIAGDGEVSEETLHRADSYGRNLGLAFQIVDDILDKDEKLLLTRAEEATEKAVEILRTFPGSEELERFTLELLNRRF